MITNRHQDRAYLGPKQASWHHPPVPKNCTRSTKRLHRQRSEQNANHERSGKMASSIQGCLLTPCSSAQHLLRKQSEKNGIH
eukprot:scaffold144989_cov17-Tisochrysis_lutea.AAC.1